MQGNVQQFAWVIGGTVVIVALARYFPKSAGWILLAIVLMLLLVAGQKGVFGRL